MEILGQNLNKRKDYKQQKNLVENEAICNRFGLYLKNVCSAAMFLEKRHATKCLVYIVNINIFSL